MHAGRRPKDGTKLNPLAIGYHYDQLHRFKESHVFTHATNIIANNTAADAVRANTTGPGGLGDYEMHVDYDMNGNIMGLDRQAYSASNDMDEFTYNYSGNTNKLNYVTDAETGTSLAGYGDIQDGQATGNYLYHDDGSLKKDLDEEIAPGTKLYGPNDVLTITGSYEKGDPSPTGVYYPEASEDHGMYKYVAVTYVSEEMYLRVKVGIFGRSKMRTAVLYPKKGSDITWERNAIVRPISQYRQWKIKT